MNKTGDIHTTSLCKYDNRQVRDSLFSLYMRCPSVKLIDPEMQNSHIPQMLSNMCLWYLNAAAVEVCCRRSIIILAFPRLKQSLNFTRLRVDVDVEIARGCRKTRDGLNVSSQSVAGVYSLASHNLWVGQITYRYPAPAAMRTSLIGTVKPSGAPFRAAS